MMQLTPAKMRQFFEFFGFDTKPILIAMVFGIQSAAYKRYLLSFVTGIAVAAAAIGFILSVLIVEIVDLFFINKETRLHKAYAKTFARKKSVGESIVNFLLDLLICIGAFYVVMLVPLHRLAKTMAGATGAACLQLLIFASIFALGKICVWGAKKLLVRVGRAIKNKFFAWR